MIGFLLIVSFPSWTFIIAAIFGGVGMFLTYAFVPDKTGIDLAVEDEQFFGYLAESGWDGDIGEVEDSFPFEGTQQGFQG